jgi:hypothetical protein
MVQFGFFAFMKSEAQNAPKLRAGEWVEVRSKEEIFATLDANGRLDDLPFMPEMFEYCGRRFRVWKRAHKTCDTVNKTGGRRVAAAVHLEDVRCDGSGHDGCEAACLIFWKESWLKRVDGSAGEQLPAGPASGPSIDDRVWRGARATDGSTQTEPIYVCQATSLPQASSQLPWWDLRQYVEDYMSGNTSLWQLLSGAIYVCYDAFVRTAGRHSHTLTFVLIGFYDWVQSRRGGVPYPRRWGAIPLGQRTPSRPLHLKPGDMVRVRPYREILSTLDVNNRNRGLFFDAEEVPYCGKTFRVRSAISRLVDERTGRMLTLKDRNVILDGAICQARYSDRRMFCPRAIYPFWRETWLERMAQPSAAACDDHQFAAEPQPLEQGQQASSGH